MSIRLSKVSKFFSSRKGHEVAAMKDVSFSACLGKVTCLVGPTGCGKTTALRMLAGLETPGSGEITLPDELSGHIGYVTQEHTLFPWLTLQKNIAYALRLRGVNGKPRQEEAIQALKAVGLENACNLYPHEASGGMRQRAMLARLLATQARLWLLDEPFSAIDEKMRQSLQESLLQLATKAEATIVFVTHNIEEAVYLADRVVVMTPSPGRVIEEHEINLPRARDRFSNSFSEEMNRIRIASEKALSADNADGHIC